MMANTDLEKKIITVALQLLDGEDTPTSETILDIVSSVVEMFRKKKQFTASAVVDIDRLVKEIETLCNVYVPPVFTLEDPRGHQEWLSSRRGVIEWNFWERYQRYLNEEIKIPPQVVRRLDDVTDQVLGRLENPLRQGSWDRRGMVVGQVQSGKTSNYTALICKAADAGYKLIIVLAGIHNSLRSQTQLRLDEGFIGSDTQKRNLFSQRDDIRLGVGRLLGAERYHVDTLTTSADRGDFNVTVANQTSIMLGGTVPVLLVVKKNASVLQNLLNWAPIKHPNSRSNSHNQIQNVPLLLIDDEADNASINTNPILDENGNLDPDLDPSRINGLIRKLLNKFEQSAYIGYTATPFANIFIADKVINEDFGEDLFPRSFITNLQPPSNYLGPAKLFGLIKDFTSDQQIVVDLPLIRQVNDYTGWIPDHHKKIHQPGPLPESVKEAIKSFILTCATRRVRAQVNVHNSMLIHVTRFTTIQTFITDQVKEELSFLQKRLRYGDGHASHQIMDELKALWDTNFEPIMQKFHETDLIPVSWSQVKDELNNAASKIEVMKINGTAKDTLQYVEHKDGLSVICIGGDKLSRGLTLEGLSISYYLRPSTMYDTLMQMGRWFGYRTGYTDLCRLYTTSELTGWYRAVATADEELRQMFEDMAIQSKTPEEYGLGVRKHPGGLTITATAKMRYARTLRVSYSNYIAETVVFIDDVQINQKNFLATERLILEVKTRGYIPREDKIGEDYIWDGVYGEAVLDFLADYTTHDMARKVRSSTLSKYIRARMANNELTEWTIGLISNSKNKKKGLPFSTKIADLDIGLIVRERLDDPNPIDSKYSIRRLVSPRDEWIDFSKEEHDRAIMLTQDAWEEEINQIVKLTQDARENDPGKPSNKKRPEIPSGKIGRGVRPSKRGLLLLYVLKYDPEISPASYVPIVGFAISFPESNQGDKSAIEIVANDVYWQQELRGEA